MKTTHPHRVYSISMEISTRFPNRLTRLCMKTKSRVCDPILPSVPYEAVALMILAARIRSAWYIFLLCLTY